VITSGECFPDRIPRNYGSPETSRILHQDFPSGNPDFISYLNSALV
jgi:hypothetical protein